MRYLILLLALAPSIVMLAVYLHALRLEWFEPVLGWIENAFHIRIAEPANMAYFLSRFAGRSAIWILIAAFYVQPMYQFIRFDLREFKKMLGGFAVAYAFAHFLLFIAAHGFALGHLGKLLGNHLFLGVGITALIILSIAPLIKSWYKVLYIGVVLVIIHLLLGYRVLSQEYVWAISLLALGLALRLVKR